MDAWRRRNWHSLIKRNGAHVIEAERPRRHPSEFFINWESERLRGGGTEKKRGDSSLWKNVDNPISIRVIIICRY